MCAIVAEILDAVVHHLTPDNPFRLPAGHPEAPYLANTLPCRRKGPVTRRSERSANHRPDRRRPSHLCLEKRRGQLASFFRKRFGQLVAEEAADKAVDCGRRAIAAGRADRIRNRWAWLCACGVYYAIRLSARRARLADDSALHALASARPDPAAWRRAEREAELVAEIVAAIRALPPRYRPVAELCLQDGLSCVRAGEALELDPVVVRQRKRRAVGLLRDALTPGWVEAG